jgi:hypothetical protein
MEGGERSVHWHKFLSESRTVEMRNPDRKSGVSGCRPKGADELQVLSLSLL